METYNDRYERHRRYFLTPGQRDLADSRRRNVIDDHIREANDTGVKLIGLSFAAGALFVMLKDQHDSRLAFILVLLGLAACVAGTAYVLTTAPKRRGRVIYERYSHKRLVTDRMRQVRSDLISRMSFRVQYLGSDADPEIRQLLAELKEIDKIEEQLLKDHSIR